MALTAAASRQMLLHPGFSNSIIDHCVTTAQASLATSRLCWLIQAHIEGYRVARLAWGAANAQPITIGFWMQASPHRYLFSVAVRNPVL